MHSEHECLSDQKIRPGTRRVCKLCKMTYSRKYNNDGRYFLKNHARYQEKNKGSQMEKARSMVMIEVRANRMPSASKFKCVDCGVNATCYDHRDYQFPFMVEPVCGSCNKKRGPGLNR